MGLLQAIKKTFGFGTQQRRTFTRKASTRKQYTKRNEAYWGTHAVQNNTRRDLTTAVRTHKTLGLSGLILLAMGETPTKIMRIDEINRVVGRLKGGRQSFNSTGLRLCQLAKEGKVFRIRRGWYTLNK